MLKPWPRMVCWSSARCWWARTSRLVGFKESQWAEKLKK